MKEMPIFQGARDSQNTEKYAQAAHCYATAS